MASLVSGARFDDFTGLLIEVQAGEGGDDAKVFSEQLFTAYLAYLARNNLEATLEETGPSKWSFTCTAIEAISLFEQETGVHCIQRVPSNERGGRRHTSCAAVCVTILRKTPVVTLKESDLEESFQRGHGKGGQNVNKVSSAVRLHHKPTGLEVFINGRDQVVNRQTARQCLAAKLVAHTKEEQTKGRATYGGAGRGNKIRTYNLMDNRITDHRHGAKCHKPDMVLKEGRFELLKG